MTLQETYNRIAEEWHKDHQTDDWWVEGTNAFVSFLKPGDAVLDIGCGGGTKSKYLLGKGLRVTGVDFSENMIAIARREIPGATFAVMDMRAIATLPDMFNGMFAQASLLHIPKHEAGDVIKNASTRLAPGGYFYVAVKEKKPDGPEETIKKEDDYGYPYERFFSYFTKDEIEGYLRGTGMEIVFSEITPSGNAHWIQVIGRK